MRSAPETEFIPRYPIMKIYLIGEAAFRQKLEGAVNRRIADAGIALPHKAMQVLGAEVVTCGKKHIQNAVALLALFHAFVSQMSSKDAPGLIRQMLLIGTQVVDTFFREWAQEFLCADYKFWNL